MNTNFHKESIIENIDFKALSKECKTTEDLSKLTKQFMKQMIEGMLQAELEEHVSQSKTTSKNGSYTKKVRSDAGEIELNIPRDRKSEFTPKIVSKGQRDISGIDDKVISMYARGMSLRDIEKQIKEMYDVEMSDTLIGRIIDKIVPQITAWQNRTLEAIYPIVYMDAMVFKIKDDNGFYKNRALHFAIGITLEGKKDLLGMWLTDNEGAKFWLQIVTELNNRGVEDILIASVDGLKGFSEAINSVFPQTIVQRCIIHQIRYSMKYIVKDNLFYSYSGNYGVFGIFGTEKENTDENLTVVNNIAYNFENIITILTPPSGTKMNILISHNIFSNCGINDFTHLYLDTSIRLGCNTELDNTEIILDNSNSACK